MADFNLERFSGILKEKGWAYSETRRIESKDGKHDAVKIVLHENKNDASPFNELRESIETAYGRDNLVFTKTHNVFDTSITYETVIVVF